MIRYDIAPDELHSLVEKRVPRWLQRAKVRTERFRKKGKYEEKRSYTNCARSFARLFRSDPAQAAEVAGLAETFLRSGSA